MSRAAIYWAVTVIVFRIADFGLRMEAQSSGIPQSAISNPQSDAVAAFDRGKAHAAKHEWEEAIAAYEEAARLYAEAGSREGETKALLQGGKAHYSMGDFFASLDLSSRSLALAESTGNTADAARASNNAGNALHGLANYAEALAAYERSLRLARETSDKSLGGIVLHNTGGVYRMLGDYARALAHYKKSLAVFQTTGQHVNSAHALGNIGLIYDHLKQYGEAIEHYERSVSLFEMHGQEHFAARMLINHGVALHKSGKDGKARDLFEKSAEILRATGDKEGLLVALANLCNLRSDAQGQVECGETVLWLAKEVAAPERVHLAHAALGRVLAASGERLEAAAHFRSAIAIVENLRSMLSESTHKSGFLGTKLEAYEGLVEMLISDVGWQMSDGGNPSSDIRHPSSESEAFETAERMKARSFLDELGAAKFSRAGVSEELLQEKRLLEARIKWLRERQ